MGVWTTSGSRDGSDTAQLIRDTVDKCRHDRKFTFQVPDQEAETHLAAGHLAQVARLLDASEALIRKDVAQREADEIYAEGVLRLDRGEELGIDELEARVDELEETMLKEDGLALAAASQVGKDDPWPPPEGAEDLLEAARAHLGEVATLISVVAGVSDGAGTPETKQPETKLRAEHARLQAMVDKLSSMLSAGR